MTTVYLAASVAGSDAPAAAVGVERCTMAWSIFAAAIAMD